MDLQHVALCHCSTHDELFLYEQGKSPVSMRNPELQDHIIYVHKPAPCPDSEDKTIAGLGNIPLNSKDYIWAITCPIYPEIQGVPGAFTVLEDLMLDGWDILKPGGKVIIPVINHIHGPYLEDFKQRVTKRGEHIGKPWSFEYNTNFESLPIIVTKPKFKKGFGVVVLTKVAVGGKRKKTRRSKKKRSTRRR